MRKLQRLLFLLLTWLPLSPVLMAARQTETVEQVNGTVTLSGAVDYVITDADPFADGAVLDITNTEEAVVILPSVKPSQVSAHLSHILINGAKAVKNTNCMVKIYANGSIILPHGKEVKPLTVYAGKGQTGESASFAAGSRQSLASHALNNRIQSFTLMRGYMVWFATKSGTTDPGYNRIFIADKENVQIDLPTILSNSISALRVSQWNDASKKGYAGWDPAFNEPLNTTWCYNWDAGVNVWDDREYVTIKQHKWWPGISDVGNNGTSANILSFNEPDNTNDPAQTPATVAEALASWPEMMATGRRLGTPAMASNWNWLYEFIDSIDARGWRCDFVAVHSYWYSDWPSWKSTLQNVKNRTGRPIWITEMNYGANWTGWPGSDRSGSAANYAIQLQHMKPILDGLEATPWIERYAYYNWVEDCRKVIDGDMKLTPIGEYYANLQSDLAYNSLYNVVPKLPKMKAPDGFTLDYDKEKRTATLKWKEYNGEYNQSMTVERRVNGVWEKVAEIAFEETAAEYTYTDTGVLNGYTYRICLVDASGKTSYTRTQETVINDLQVGDALSVGGRNRYVGGNLMPNPDFDLGTLGWTNGQGQPLTDECFTVVPVGGIDGGAFLRAWSSETGMNTAGALKTFFPIQPGQDYYFSGSVCNDEVAMHRLSLTKDGSKEDSVAASFSLAPVWASQSFTFNSGDYTQAMFVCRRMNGKSLFDKFMFCALFDSREEAIADGVACLRRRAAVVQEHVAVHPELVDELSQVLAAVDGTDESCYIQLAEAIENALTAAREKAAMESLLAKVRRAVELQVPGFDLLQAAMNLAEQAQTAAEYIQAAVALRSYYEEFVPQVYAANLIGSPDFASVVPWKTGVGTYTGGDQRRNTVAGKSCWNAWWSGLSASEGKAQTMEIRQEVAGLTHGFYALECKAATQLGCLADQHAYLTYEGDTLSSSFLTYDYLDVATAADSVKWETLSTPLMYVPDEGSLTIGFVGSKQGAVDGAWRPYTDAAGTRDNREGWWCATDFALRYMPGYRCQVPASGWGAICLPYQMTPTDGVHLYQIAGLSADYTLLYLEEVTETAAGVPYIYQTTLPEVFFYGRGESVSKAATVNNLRGNFQTSARVPAKSYALTDGGWVRVATSDRPYMLDYSAIIRSVSSLPVLQSWDGASMPISGAADEMAQGIGSILVDGQTPATDGLYTPNGQRVTAPVSGQVYIRVQGGKAEKFVY